MEVTLIKRFGKYDAGTTLDANDRLQKHLEAGGWIDLKAGKLEEKVEKAVKKSAKKQGK